jgi:hypothetical protein
VSELPLDVATYLTHSPDPGQVRVLIAARTPGEIVPADWGVAIMEGSRPVTGRTAHVDAGTPAPWQATISIDVPPGRYRLRAAAVTGDGRFGVLDLAMRAGLRAGDDASLSDLVVGAVAGGQLQPREVLGQYDRAAAMIELSSPHALDGTTGELTVTPWEGATPAAHAILTLRPRQDDTSVVVGEAPLDLSTVAPGTYTVTAALTRGGAPIGRVSRLVDVVAGTPVGPLASRPAPAISKRTSVLKADPAATALMQRVGEYVARYGDAASVLLATEHYRQEATQKSQVGLDRGTELSHGILTGGTPVSSAKTARTLTSEMALVRNASAVGGWLGFRSVTGVDGKSVGDSARLKALFGAAVPDVEAARRISEESARLNVGPITRTFNVPTSALFFFTPANLSRFAFHHDGEERIEGVDTWRIAFQEVAAPTLIMTVAGRDVPSTGMLWVNPADASVLRTRLSVLDYAGTSSVALVEVTYRREPSVDLLVPASMREWYNVGLASVAAEATYSDYKRFQTSIRIK